MEELGIDDNEPSLTKAEKQATIADLIKSRSGIYHPALGEAPIMKAMRPERHSHAPGTFYYYNNWDFNAVGTIFEQETGTKIFQEFDRRIAKPLQTEDFNVDDCWYGTGDQSKHRYYGFRMSARDLARFGLLYLREGRWRDRQIVPAEWVRESTATHSVIGSYLGYGYMWRTSENGGPYYNIRVKTRTFGHSGLGVHFFMVLPSRNLVIVHRVNTDIPGPYPNSNQLGRLLWLILDAAGETEIGENPSIEAAKGVRLTADDFEELLGRGTITARGVTPPGLVERSEKSFIALIFQNGTISVKGGFEDTGKWWFEGDKFCTQWKQIRSGKKDCSYLVLDKKILKTYSLNGTLDGRLQIFQE
jgi:CubicO group peptidase (beta-lactamase class C family)